MCTPHMLQLLFDFLLLLGTYRTYLLFHADIKSAFTSKAALLKEMTSSTPAENTNEKLYININTPLVRDI